MTENTTIAKRILQFNEALANSSFDLPEGYRTVNPYSGDQSELVQKITTAFYQKYYNDTKLRRIILGSSPPGEDLLLQESLLKTRNTFKTKPVFLLINFL